MSTPLSDHDKELFAKFKKLISDESDTISFMRNELFGSSFDGRPLKPLHSIRDNWKGAAFEFDDSKINKAWLTFLAQNNIFLKTLISNTFPHPVSVRTHFFFGERTEEKEEWIDTISKKVNKLANQWFSAYNDFIRVYRSECASATGPKATPQKKKKPSKREKDTDATSSNDSAHQKLTVDTPVIPKEELETALSLILFMLTQAYYTILQLTVGNNLSGYNPDLNSHYLWVLKNIRSLLKNSKELQDFPLKFNPPFENLMPSTIENVDWDMISYEMDDFMATVQQYSINKEGVIPKENSTAQLVLDTFKNSITEAIECAKSHKKQLDDTWTRVYSRKNTTTPQKPEVDPEANKTPNTEAPCKTPTWFAITNDYASCHLQVQRIRTEEGYDTLTDENALCSDEITPKLQIKLLGCKLKALRTI